MERCPSGLRSTTGTRVYGNPVSRVRIPFSPPYFLKITFLTSFCVSLSTTQNPSICGLPNVLVRHCTRTSLSPISPFYPQNLHFWPLHLRYMRTLRSEVRMSSNPVFAWVLENQPFCALHFLENERRSSDWDSKWRNHLTSR